MITGKNKPTRSVNGYDDNLPPGLDKDPGDVLESITCPHCKGDRLSPISEGDLCETCDGEGEVLPQVYDDYKTEAKFDQQANEA